MLIGTAAGMARIYNKSQKEHDKNTVVCNECHAEIPIGANFCPSCRNTNLIRKKEFKKEELKSKQRQDEIRKRQLEIEYRIESAKQYYENAKTMRVCRSCNISFTAEAKYCTNCGISTEGVSSDTVLAWMISEFPDIVATPKDIELLESFVCNNKISIGKIILGTSKAALKGTLWAGTKIGDTILKELSKKQ